jgi:hypothetical protein
MAQDMKLSEQGLERYAMSRVILGNLLIILWIVVGTIAVWFFSPVVATVYLIVAVIVVYFVLRKLVCTNCYYYDKWCSMGWGKLAAVLFKQGRIEEFNESIGVRLAPIVYGLLTFFPLIVVVYVIIGEMDFYKVTVLAILLVFSVLSGSVSRRSACASCKMNTVCKGSAVKQKA